MAQSLPQTMQAMALDRFGGPETLGLQTLPIPELAPHELLLRVAVAGVGEWDPFEGQGGYAEMMGIEPTFPYILGSEGAGDVVAVGAEVRGIKVGDQVYAPSFLNPKGGFYAEYVVVDAAYVSPIPSQLTIEQAGVMAGVGTTALRGLDDTLHLQPGESVLIFGASGGIGHLAVQLAKRMGARVFAVASGEDGVALVNQVGADAVVDGHKGDLRDAAHAFAPQGFDAALLTAGGSAAEQALSTVRKGGRAAYPTGIQPEPQTHPGIELRSYNGEPDPALIQKFHQLVEAGPFTVHLAQTFPLAQAADAHRALERHYLGKLALRVR